MRRGPNAFEIVPKGPLCDAGSPIVIVPFGAILYSPRAPVTMIPVAPPVTVKGTLLIIVDAGPRTSRRWPELRR